MTPAKTILCLSLGLSLLGCSKKHDSPKGDRYITLSTGVSLKDDSPFAESIPYMASCSSTDPEIAKACTASKIPFIGERGEPITRELIKQHGWVSNNGEARVRMEKYIDQLPEELLPLFARVRVVSDSSFFNANADRDASWGRVGLSPFLALTCEPNSTISYCKDEVEVLPPSKNMISAIIPKDPSRKVNTIEYAVQLYTLRNLCNLADAYGTYDISDIKSKQDESGKIAFSRYSRSSAYSYETHDDLQAYWDNSAKELADQKVIDHNKLVAALDDTSISAVNDSSGYKNATEDFIETCAYYLVAKVYETEHGTMILDPKTGEVFKTKKNQLGDAAVKAKLAKMLPVIFAEPADALSYLEALPASSEFAPETTQGLLRNFKFQ